MKYLFIVLIYLIIFPVQAMELIIKTNDGEHIFQTEIADTPEKQKKGLMFKKEIPNDFAMTFLFSDMRMIHMWMKNTYLPLDMIFFDSYGIITHIHKNAEPFSEDFISSALPAKGVIEVLAGTVHERNIQIGDMIELKKR